MDANIAEGLKALAALHKDVPNAGTESILLVDDEPLILDIASEGLSDLGYKVKAVTTAADAIQAMVDGFTPDILCTDIVLPGGLNGVGLARELRSVMPRVKVLLVTGYGDASMIDGTTNQDGFKLLAKPYMINDLASRVRQILDNR